MFADKNNAMVCILSNTMKPITVTGTVGQISIQSILGIQVRITLDTYWHLDFISRPELRLTRLIWNDATASWFWLIGCILRFNWFDIFSILSLMLRLSGTQKFYMFIYRNISLYKGKN